MVNKAHIPFILALTVMLGIFSCVDPPEYPIEPEIEFVSISADTITAISDEIIITFSFTDGDGDLGFEQFSGDSCDLCDSSCYQHPTYSLFLVDSREGLVDSQSVQCLQPYDMPFVPTKGSSDAIAGEIDVKVSGVFCFPFVATDSLFYYVTLRDRAGHFSNTIQTPVFYLRCQ